MRLTVMASQKRIFYIVTVVAISDKCHLPTPYLNSTPVLITGGILQPGTLFRCPFPAELTGISFNKLASIRYFALWFPRALKTHKVRNTISFEELQDMTKRCSEAPDDREERDWLERSGCWWETQWVALGRWRERLIWAAIRWVLAQLSCNNV